MPQKRARVNAPCTIWKGAVGHEHSSTASKPSPLEFDVGGVIVSKANDGKWNVRLLDGRMITVARKFLKVLDDLPGGQGSGDPDDNDTTGEPIGIEDAAEEDIEEDDGEAPTDVQGWSSGNVAVTEDERAKRGFNSMTPGYLRVTADVVKTIVLFFFSFFPVDLVPEIISLTMAAGQAKYSPTWSLDEDEFWTFLAMRILMTTCVFDNPQDYFNPNPDPLSPRYYLGAYMTYNKFDEITRAFTLPTYEDAAGDPHFRVRRFVDSLNERWRKVFEPGSIVTADESMIPWTGRGMPGFMKVPRKPHPFGAELKTVACAFTKVLFRMDIQEGGEEMKKKPENKEYGAGTACLIRLTKNLVGTGRIVIADSWFGSFKACREMLSRGLFSILNVKTAHSNFPKLRLLSGLTNRGDWLSFTRSTDVDGEERTLTACGHLDKKPMLLVASCATTLAGNPKVKRYMKEFEDGDKARVVKVIPQPVMCELYRCNFNAVDVHNHYRQGFGSMSEIWKTTDWVKRYFAELFGKIVVNAFLAWNAMCDVDPMYTKFPTFLSFRRALAQALLDLHGPAARSKRACEPTTEPTDCKLVKLSASTPKKLMACSYCGKRSTFKCEKCSTRTHPLVVCRGDLGCWGMHINGEEGTKRVAYKRKEAAAKVKRRQTF